MKSLFDICPFCGGKMELNERQFFNDCASDNMSCILMIDMDKDGNFMKAEFNDQPFSSIDEILRFAKLRAFE